MKGFLCKKKIFGGWLLSACLLFSIFSVFLFGSRDASATITGGWTNSSRGVYLSYGGVSNNQNTYDEYVGCTNTAVDLQNGNYYDNNISWVYNVHISSRGTNNLNCLFGAGGSLGFSEYVYNRFIINAYVDGYSKNFDTFRVYGVFKGSDGSLVEPACSALPANATKSQYNIKCIGTFSDNETLADYDIYFNGPWMDVPSPMITRDCSDDRQDYNTCTRASLSSRVTIDWESDDQAPQQEDDEILQEIKDVLESQDERQIEKYQQQQDEVESDIGGLNNDISGTSSSLLRVFQLFIQAITSVDPSDCNFTIDLFSASAFGAGDEARDYNVNLCSLPVPSAFATVGSIVMIFITVTVSYFAVRKFISLLKEVAN